MMTEEILNPLTTVVEDMMSACKVVQALVFSPEKAALAATIFFLPAQYQHLLSADPTNWQPPLLETIQGLRESCITKLENVSLGHKNTVNIQCLQQNKPNKK